MIYYEYTNIFYECFDTAYTLLKGSQRNKNVLLKNRYIKRADKLRHTRTLIIVYYAVYAPQQLICQLELYKNDIIYFRCSLPSFFESRGSKRLLRSSFDGLQESFLCRIKNQNDFLSAQGEIYEQYTTPHEFWWTKIMLRFF